MGELWGFVVALAILIAAVALGPVLINRLFYWLDRRGW